MSNHIVIGLGGTGCAVVREFKKLLYAEWRARGGEGSAPMIMDFNERFGGQLEEVRIATLSVDSNQDDLDGGRDDWLVMGEQLTLQDDEKVLLMPQGLGNVLTNFSQYPGIKPWIENERDQVAEITRGSDQPNGCDQIRRLGRLMLANGNNLANLIDKFNAQRSRLISGGSVDLTIHVCCTLGCGTGSGTLIDVVTQLKKSLNSEKSANFQIFLYGFATASDVGPVNTGNFYANQYAVLQELNALRVGQYKPWDLSARNQPERLEVKDAFSAAFITTNTTESRQNLTLPEQVEMTSEFLFQKLVRLMGVMPARLKKAHTFEDVKAYPVDEDGSDRSTRFASFGVKRLVIPEKEIHEKLAYSFCEQFLLKGLYDNWAGGENGFIDAPLDFGDDSFVRKRRMIWGIGHEQLSLDKSDKEVGDDDHKPFKTEWEEEVSELRDATIEDFGENGWEDWLQDFDRQMEGVWKSGFRKKGVDNYFNNHIDSKALSKRARKLVRHIECDLLEGFETLKEHYHVAHYGSVVRRIKDSLEQDRRIFAEEVEEAEKNRRKTEELCDGNADDFISCGFIARKLGKHREIFQAYARARRDAHLHMTEARAAEYGVRLVDAMMPDLDRLLSVVERFAGALKRMQEKHRTWIANRIREDAEEDDNDEENVITYVDPIEVNGSIQRMETDSDMQELNASTCVAAVKNLRSPSEGFEAYLANMGSEDEDSVGEFGKRLHGVAFAQSRMAHDKLAEDKAAKFDPVLGQNIVKKLSIDNGGSLSGELEARLRKFMTLAMPAATFDGNATPLGHYGVTSPIFGRSVFLPDCEEASAFREDLKQRIGTMSGTDGRAVKVEVHDIPEQRSSSEIVFLSTGYFFPLRMLTLTSTLREKFAERIGADSRRARFQVFTETHLPGLPDLMRPDDAARRSEALVYLVIGKATGLLDCPELNGSNSVALRLTRKDEVGRSIDPVDLGIPCDTADREIAAESTGKFGRALSPAVAALVRSHGRFDPDRSGAVKDKVLTDLQAKLKDAGADAILHEIEELEKDCFVLQNRSEDDPAYLAFVQAGKTARELLKSLN